MPPTPNADEPTEDKTLETPPADDAPADEEPTDEDGTDSNDDDADGEKKGLSLEEALAEVEKTRKEAANYRRRLRETESRMAEAKTPEEVEAIIAELRAEREEAERSLLIENAALKYSLPPALAARLQGKTREEIEADAKSLAAFVTSDDDDSLGGGLDPTRDRDDTPTDPGELAKRVNRGRKSLK